MFVKSAMCFVVHFARDMICLQLYHIFHSPVDFANPHTHSPSCSHSQTNAQTGDSQPAGAGPHHEELYGCGAGGPRAKCRLFCALQVRVIAFDLIERLLRCRWRLQLWSNSAFVDLLLPVIPCFLFQFFLSCRNIDASSIKAVDTANIKVQLLLLAALFVLSLQMFPQGLFALKNYWSTRPR